MAWLQGLFKKSAKAESLALPDLRDWLLVQYHLRIKQHNLQQQAAQYAETLQALAATFRLNYDLWQEQLAHPAGKRVKDIIVLTRRLTDSLKFSEDKLTSALQVQKTLAPLPQLIVVIENASPLISEVLPSPASQHPLHYHVQKLQELQEEFAQKLEEAGLQPFTQLQVMEKNLSAFHNSISRHRDHLRILQLRLQQTQERRQQKAEEIVQLTALPEYQQVRKYFEEAKLLAAQQAASGHPADTIKKGPALIKMEEAEYKFAHFKEQEAHLQQEITETTTQLEQLQQDGEKERNACEQLLHDALQRNITLTLEPF